VHFQVRTIYILCTLLLFALLHTHEAAAQLQNNRLHINGTVVDPKGSTIDRARVSLRHEQRTLETTNTDQEGRFEIVADESRNLSIDIECPGFDDVTLQLEQTTAFPLRIVLTPRAVSADVTITATRTATRLSETAASVVVIDSQDLKTTSALTLDDTLRQVAGFSLFRRSGSRTANPTSQGVSLRATGASGASRALVLADDVPLNDPFGGWVYWDRVPRESIDQVEVLLGGASHLYGNAALGGVIDVQTKSPHTNALALSASYGNETTPNASLFASTTTHGWSGSIAAETFRTDGYVLVPENERGTVDTAAGSRDSVINLKVEKKITDESRLFGGASFFGESRENGTPLQTNRTHLRQFVIGGSWNSTTAGFFSGRVYGGTQVYDQNFSAISTDRNSETLTRVQRVPAQVFGETTRWSRSVGRRQTFVAGFEAREVRGASDEIAYVNGRPTSFIGAGGRERDAGGYFEI
jgi:outer membrane receptor protein involved in Fe transport